MTDSHSSEYSFVILQEDRCYLGLASVIVETFLHLAFKMCLCVLQVLAFYSLYEQCEQAVENSENWLKVQAPPASEPEPLSVQLDRCQVGTSVTGAMCHSAKHFDVPFYCLYFCLLAIFTLNLHHL